MTLITMSFTRKWVYYNMFFLGHNFVYGVYWTVNQKTLKT